MKVPPPPAGLWWASMLFSTFVSIWCLFHHLGPTPGALALVGAGATAAVGLARVGA